MAGTYENWKIGDAAVTGWSSTFEMSMASPAIANRIYKKLEDAQAYVDNDDGSACQGLILSVVGETGADASNNGIYQIQFTPGKDETSDRHGRYILVRVDASAAQVTAGEGIRVTGDNMISVNLANRKATREEHEANPELIEGVTDMNQKSGLTFEKVGVGEAAEKRLKVAINDHEHVEGETDPEDDTHYSGLETNKHGLGIKERTDTSSQVYSGLEVDDKGVGVKLANIQRDGVNATYESGLGKDADGVKVKLADLTPATHESGLKTTDKGLQVVANANGSVKVTEAGVSVNVDDTTITHKTVAGVEGNPEHTELAVNVAGDQLVAGDAPQNSGKNIIKVVSDGREEYKGLFANVYINEVAVEGEGSQNISKAYQLVTKNTDSEGHTTEVPLGKRIDIAKDQSLGSVALVEAGVTAGDALYGDDAPVAPTFAEGETEKVVEGRTWKKGQFLRFEYILADGKHQWIYLDVSTFLTQAEFKDGLSVDTNKGEVSVKLGKGLRFDETITDANKPIDVKLSRDAADTAEGVQQGHENAGLIFGTDGNKGLKVNAGNGLKIENNIVQINPEFNRVGEGMAPQDVSGLSIKNDDNHKGTVAVKAVQGVGVGTQGVYVKAGNGLSIDDHGNLNVDSSVTNDTITESGNALKKGTVTFGPQGAEVTKQKLDVVATELRAKHQVTTGQEGVHIVDPENSIVVTPEKRNAETGAIDSNGGLATAAEVTPLLLKKKSESDEVAFTVTNPLGNFTLGEAIPWNEGVYEVLKRLLCKVYPPKVNDATLNLSISTTGNRVEVGANTPEVKAHYTFTDGSYKYDTTWKGSGHGQEEANPYEEAAGSSVTSTSVTGSNIGVTTLTTTDTKIADPFVMTDNDIKITIAASSSNGHASKNSDMSSNNTNIVNGKSPSTSCTWKPGYKCFWGYANYDAAKGMPTQVQTKDGDLTAIETALGGSDLQAKDALTVGDTIGDYNNAFQSTTDTIKRTFVVIVPESYGVTESHDHLGGVNTDNWKFKGYVEGRTSGRYAVWCAHLTKDGSAVTSYKDVKVGKKIPTQEIQP